MEIKTRLQNYIGQMFETAPKTRAAQELQEELLANCMEKYDDLTAQGMVPEAAYQSVVAGIGNAQELARALPAEQTPISPEWEAERRKRTAVVTAIAVGLYVLALVVLFSGVFLGNVTSDSIMVFIGLIVAGLICIVPTGMLVYNAVRWPKYEKIEETVVEEFKEWSSGTKKKKSMFKAVSAVIWSVALVLYFAVSFKTFYWSITWIVFLIAACAEAVTYLVFTYKELKK